MFKKLSEMPAFQRALKDIRSGKKVIAPKTRVEPLWVKKKVSAREWNTFYSHNPSYCKLGEEGAKANRRIIVGFMVANVIRDGVPQYPTGTCPKNCTLLTDEEALKVDYYRRAKNIYPRLTDQ